MSGESDVIVKGSKTIINGVVTKENVIPREILFTLDKRFNKYCHKIMLNDNYLAQDKLDITIILYLENNRGYKYSESVIMQFENQHDTGEYKFWRLHKYNMVIKWKIFAYRKFLGPYKAGSWFWDANKNMKCGKRCWFN